MSKNIELNNWNPVFNDDGLNKTLKEHGIVKIKLNGFNSDNIQSFIKQNVKGYPEQFESNFYGSFLSPDLELKQEVHQGLSKLIDPILEPILFNQQTLSYFFIVKGKGGDSIVNLHQDWSIVDERKYRGLTLWIPLINSTSQNGTLHVIKGSHLFPLNIRGGSIPSKYDTNLPKEVLRLLEPINVNMGEALIFDSRLLHYSPPNHSNTSRTSIISNIIPNQAETMCFTQEEVRSEKVVYSYQVPRHFYMQYDDFLTEKNFPHKNGSNKTKIDHANTELVSSEELKLFIKKYIRPRKKWFFF